MVLPIDPSYNQIAFCGKNNVGKTNTLRAINLFFHPESYQMSEDMPKFMDATDALAAAYCHFMQTNSPISTGKKYSSWKDFATKNKERVSS